MAKLKVDNGLYFHVRSMLNAVLPLEYTIRAFRSKFPDQFLELSDINNKIHTFWISQGFSNDEIAHELLIDHSWDFIQFRWPMARIHGRVFLSTSFFERIKCCLQKVQNKFYPIIFNKNYPFVDRYRIADLMNGNDISYILSKTISIRKAMNSYSKKDNIPLSKFALKVRYPIFWYPNTFYISGKSNKGGYTGICLDNSLAYDDVISSINEFIYQYAKSREQYNMEDDDARKLINNFLSDNLFGVPKEDSEVTRIDSILTGISGLLCFDEVEKEKNNIKNFREHAIDYVLNYYPEEERNAKRDLVKKNYVNVKLKIDEIAKTPYIRKYYEGVEFIGDTIIYNNIME